MYFRVIVGLIQAFLSWDASVPLWVSADTAQSSLKIRLEVCIDDQRRLIVERKHTIELYLVWVSS